jgi:hypothetical protein
MRRPFNVVAGLALLVATLVTPALAGPTARVALDVSASVATSSYGNVPRRTHIKSERHQNALRAAERRSSEAVGRPGIGSAAGEHGEGRPS